MAKKAKTNQVAMDVSKTWDVPIDPDMTIEKISLNVFYAMMSSGRWKDRDFRPAAIESVTLAKLIKEEIENGN